jgi:UDP-N-acetylmuramoylalanine--D-glutamate ligase
MKRETVLLLGGQNKGYDYGKLFAALQNGKVVRAVLYGENRFAILKSARAYNFDRVTLCEDFAFAVRVAAMLAKEGQAVLLSPASASFDEFAGYEERGDRFVEIVQSFSNEEEYTDETETENEDAEPLFDEERE